MTVFLLFFKTYIPLDFIYSWKRCKGISSQFVMTNGSDSPSNLTLFSIPTTCAQRKTTLTSQTFEQSANKGEDMPWKLTPISKRRLNSLSVKFAWKLGTAISRKNPLVLMFARFFFLRLFFSHFLTFGEHVLSAFNDENEAKRRNSFSCSNTSLHCRVLCWQFGCENVYSGMKNVSGTNSSANNSWECLKEEERVMSREYSVKHQKSRSLFSFHSWSSCLLLYSCLTLLLEVIKKFPLWCTSK